MKRLKQNELPLVSERCIEIERRSTVRCCRRQGKEGCLGWAQAGAYSPPGFATNRALSVTIPSAGRSPRTTPHSHIKALGLTCGGFATIDGAGFIVQTNAREVRARICRLFLLYILLQACGVVVDLIKSRKFSGRAWNRKDRIGSRCIP